MSRFKTIPPLDMSAWFVKNSEKTTFEPRDWNMPIPWISSFLFTHLSGHFWGISNTNPYSRPRVLQIGCGQGWDAVENAKILKLPHINGELHIIDWFKGNLTIDEGHVWSYNENNPENWKANLWNQARKYSVNDIITIFEGDSREMIHKVNDDYYDIVFIDGGHEYNIVKSDIENGYKKLKSNGIMVFDDFSGGVNSYNKFDIKNASTEMLEIDTYVINDHRIHVGVVKAVHEFFNGNYIVCDSHDKAYHMKGYTIKHNID